MVTATATTTAWGKNRPVSGKAIRYNRVPWSLCFRRLDTSRASVSFP